MGEEKRELQKKLTTLRKEGDKVEAQKEVVKATSGNDKVKQDVKQMEKKKAQATVVAIQKKEIEKEKTQLAGVKGTEKQQEALEKKEEKLEKKRRKVKQRCRE